MEQVPRWQRWHAAAGAFCLGLVQPFVPVLAIRLGATNVQLGSLAALPNLLAIPALLLSGRLFGEDDKFRGVALSTVLARAILLGMVLVPMAPGALQVVALQWVWAAAMAANVVAITGMNALVADQFAPARRGRVLAARGAAGTAAGMVAGLLAGTLLDSFSFPAGYQGLFVAAAVCGALEWAALRRISEVADGAANGAAPGALGPTARTPGRSSWTVLWRYRPLRAFFLASASLHLCWQAIWPVFNRYHITVLGAGNIWVSVIAVMGSLGSVLTYSAWVRWGERWGNRRMVILAVLGLAMAPLVNVLAPSLPVIAALNLLSGAAVSGTTILLLALLLEVTPAPERPFSLAAHQALVAAMGSVAPLLGGWLMDVATVQGALWIGFAARLLLGAGAFALLEWREVRRTRRAPPA